MSTITIISLALSPYFSIPETKSVSLQRFPFIEVYIANGITTLPSSKPTDSVVCMVSNETEQFLVMERTTGVAGVVGVLEPEPPAAAPSGSSRPSMVWYFFWRDMAYTDT